MLSMATICHVMSLHVIELKTVLGGGGEVPSD